MSEHRQINFRCGHHDFFREKVKKITIICQMPDEDAASKGRVDLEARGSTLITRAATPFWVEQSTRGFAKIFSLNWQFYGF